MSHKDMIVLLFLINVFGLESGENCTDRGNLTLTLTPKMQMEIKILLESGPNITVKDHAKALTCNSKNNPCYIECPFYDFFANKNYTEPEHSEICVKKTKNTRIDFLLVNKINCTVVDCVIDDVMEFMDSKSKSDNLEDLGNFLSLKNMCSNVIFNLSATDFYIRLEKRAIHNIINATNSEKNKTYFLEDLSLTVVNVANMNLTQQIEINAPGVLNSVNPATILIPTEVFQKYNKNKIGILTYDTDEIFELKLNNQNITSKVIRIEMPGCDVAHLSNPIKMDFTIEREAENDLSCQYYDEKGSNIWKPDGCKTVTNQTIVTCFCNHMTPFSVLLTTNKVDSKNWEILSSITYTGCTLSAFFSAVSVFSYLISSNARAEVSSSIHMFLSGALFLLNMSFMLSEWVASLKVKEACVFIAVTIHYSLLSSFTWMAVEALHLYLLLIRVFNIDIRHYMAKLSLIGWGVPALVVGGLLSVYNTKPLYGPYDVQLSDNVTKKICGMSDNQIWYGVNLSYFSIVFLFNLAILVTVTRQICKLRTLSPNKKPYWKDVSTVMGLMCLMGTTWGLAFFSFGENNIVIIYMFCIFNTLQGFCIFLWMCATVRKNREKSLQSKSKSTLEVSK